MWLFLQGYRMINACLPIMFMLLYIPLYIGYYSTFDLYLSVREYNIHLHS